VAASSAPDSCYPEGVDILTIILVLLLVAALVGAVSFSEVIWVLVAFLLIVLALRAINTRGRF
jgi:hypothetical protein